MNLRVLFFFSSIIATISAFTTTPKSITQSKPQNAVVTAAFGLPTPVENDDVVSQPRGAIQSIVNKGTVAAAAVATLLLPLAAIAEEAEDYEYGAVNAPIGIAWGLGVIAILTSFLPLALKGGEEAFEEMKERDAGTFGKNKDVLNKRR